MNRTALLLTLFVAAFTVACSGGGSTPTPPPPTGGFTNADLKGQYAFIMSGVDSTNFFFLGRVGSFTADGNGNITGGVEDFSGVTAGPGPGLMFTSSTYSIQADGRGTINLTNATGTLIFSVTLLSRFQGYIVETDLNATTSGTFTLQNSADFSTTALSGGYVFDATGIDPGGNPDSIVGQLTPSGTNGGGPVGGVLDENDSANASGPLAVTGGSYSLDSTYGTSNGRGFLSVIAGGNTYSFTFYIVDSTRIRMIETPTLASGIRLGDAVLQTNPPTANTQFTGSFVYLQGGQSITGPVTRVGRFTANNGVLSSIALNSNDSGTAARVPNGSLSAMTYQIDPNYPGSGRGTATFTDSKLGTYSYIFYMNTPSQGVIQDNSQNIVADGTILAQTGGPFTNTSLAGKYGFNFSGVGSNGSTGATAEEDYVGQLALSSSSSNNVSGAADFSSFSSNQGVFLNIVVNGQGLTIQGDGTTATGNSNTLQLKFNTNPSSTLNFAAYIVNPQTMFVAGTDKDHVIAGALAQQSK